MAYTRLRNSWKAIPKNTITSTWWTSWVNLLTAPELLDNSFVTTMDNYFIPRPWELEKAKWRIELFDTWGWVPVTMLEKYNDDIYIYAQWTTVWMYTISTDTKVELKTDFTTDDKFTWAVYWDFCFVCNWVDELYRIQPILWSELLTNWDFTVWTWWTLTWWASIDTWAWKLIISSLPWAAAQTVVTTPWEQYIFDHDFDSSSFSTTENQIVWITNPDTTLLPNSKQIKFTASSTSFKFNVTWTGTWEARYDNLSLKAVTAALEIVAVPDAPSPKIIRVVKDRLFLWDVDDEVSKTLWSNQDTQSWEQRKAWVPFTIFSSTSSNLLATASKSTYASHLWTLKDIVSVDNPNLWNVIMPIHENGYYWFDLQINEALEQVTRVNFDVKWNWGFRGIDTPEWVFIINKTWIWHVQEPWREKNVIRILWQEFWDTVDASNADLMYDNNKDMLLATVDTDWDWVNDTVIWRSQIEVINEQGEAIAGWATWKYNLWENTVLMLDWLKVYWGDNDWSVYQLFSWTDDNWSDITANFEQEMNLSWVNNLFELTSVLLKWFTSNGWSITVDIDIYEKDMTKTVDKKTLTVTMPASWDNQEMRMFENVSIDELQRIIVRIESTDQKSHKFTYIQLETISKWQNIKTQNLS